MKQATLLAIISISILALIPLMHLLTFNFGIAAYQGVNLLSVLAYAGLLPFFVRLYKKQ